MQYNGIELVPANGKVVLSHSDTMDMIQGKSSTENMDWTETLGGLPWDLLKKECSPIYLNTCNLFSLLNMDYEVCNGGIEQYFCNGYHEGKDPLKENDVELFDIEGQKDAFAELVNFGRSVFPERIDENNALARAAEAFQGISFEEDAKVWETIECEEDEYILDEETGEEIENPDYFEPYDDYHYEDVIHGGDGFDDIFYEANEYFEELLELQAQYYCKLFARSVEKNADKFPEITAAVRAGLPAEAFGKEPLADRITDATTRAAESSPGHSAPAKAIDHEI